MPIQKTKQKFFEIKKVDLNFEGSSYSIFYLGNIPEGMKIIL